MTDFAYPDEPIPPWVIAEFSFGQDLGEIQEEYRDRIFSAMQDYLQSDKPITAYRNDFRQAINDAFTYAFYAGWADAGASGGLTDEAQGWLSDRIGEELGYLDTLFVQLKALRDDKDTDPEDKLDAAEAHADGYANSLTGVYAMGKMMGEPERDGEWEFGDTDHCDTCASLNGQVHPLSWYIDGGYIPQEAGNDNLDCKGYNCKCIIKDPKTGEQLIP